MKGNAGMKRLPKVLAMALAVAAVQCGFASSATEGMTFDRIYDGVVSQDVADWSSGLGANFTLAANSTVGITNGTFTTTTKTKASSIGAGATFVALKGATLKATGERAFGFSSSSGKFVADEGATLNIYPKSNTEAYFGDKATSCSWEILNGSSLKTAGQDAQTTCRTIRGTGNRIVVCGGSTFDASASHATQYKGRQLRFASATDCALAISNSTLKLNGEAFSFENTKGSLASFHNATVSGSAELSINSASASNTVEVCGASGSWGFTGVTMDGTDNVFRIGDATVGSSIVVTGLNNRVELSGAGYDWSKCRLDGDGGTVALLPGGVRKTEYAEFPVFGSGTNGVIDINGGSCVFQRAITFSGSNAAVRVRRGGKLIGATYNDTRCRQALNFTAGATSNFHLQIEEDGVLEVSNSVCASGMDLKSHYNWTNCPNSSITFKGRNPRFTVAGADGYIGMALGTPDEEPLVDPVVLRFEVPAEGYAAAPIQHAQKTREIALCGNQPIEVVVDSEMLAKPHAKIVIPLIYDRAGFHTTDNHSMNVPLTEARLRLLQANATLPEGAYFKVTSETAGKTLNVIIPSNMGLTVILK